MINIHYYRSLLLIYYTITFNAFQNFQGQNFMIKILKNEMTLK